LSLWGYQFTVTGDNHSENDDGYNDDRQD